MASDLVVADVIDCARNMDRKKPLGWGEAEENYVVDYKSAVNPLYIRAEVTDKANALQDVVATIGKVQVLEFAGCKSNELAFVTGAMAESELTEKLNGISSISIKSLIRVTDY